MSGWWSLPQAAPILLRHLSAYAELAEQDISVAQEQFSSRLLAIAIAFLAGLFTLLMLCVAVVAATWDTPHRMLAVYCLLALFAATLVLAIAYLARVNASGQAFLASVKREWAVDRVQLDRFLSKADGKMNQGGTSHD